MFYGNLETNDRIYILQMRFACKIYMQWYRTFLILTEKLIMTGISLYLGNVYFFSIQNDVPVK
jgi:hypothetical protein